MDQINTELRLEIRDTREWLGHMSNNLAILSYWHGIFIVLVRLWVLDTVLHWRKESKQICRRDGLSPLTTLSICNSSKLAYPRVRDLFTSNVSRCGYKSFSFYSYKCLSQVNAKCRRLWRLNTPAFKQSNTIVVFSKAKCNPTEKAAMDKAIN